MSLQAIGAGFRLVALRHGPGESAPFFLPRGAFALRLQVDGPGRPGVGLRLMVGDDASTWREVGCYSTDDPLLDGAAGQAVDCQFPLHTSATFGRLVVDWMSTGAQLLVSISGTRSHQLQKDV